MMTIGIDAHKASHTAVAVDEVGRWVDEVTVTADSGGLVELVGWAGQWDVREWAVEDARHVTGRLEAHLLGGGEVVWRVPPALTGPSRRAQRTAGKSDAVDAEAVARAALAHEGLPAATVPDRWEADIRALSDYRTQAVAAKVEVVNRHKARCHRNGIGDPGRFNSWAAIDRARHAWAGFDGVEADLARRELDRIEEAFGDIADIDHQLAELLDRHPLLDVPGVGTVLAAEIIAIIGDINRFDTPDQLARYTGVAPIPASSGNTNRHRLHRGGHRRLNRAIHLIALTQARYHPDAINYLEKRTSDGKTRREAIRCLKRYITRRVYTTLKHHQLT